MFRKAGSGSERRSQERRAFSHYVQFRNDRTGELTGDLADISRDGFRLEGSKSVALNAELHFRVDLPPDTPGRTSIVFTALSRWMRRHPIDPRMYISGYEITRMDPVDSRAFQFLYDRYGSTSAVRDAAKDYLWKD